VQFDNATVFTGPRHPNCVGQTVRFCLSLGITPVFVPPRETGFQANIERFNGQWQKANWERFNFKNLEQLNKQLKLYVEALCDKKHTPFSPRLTDMKFQKTGFIVTIIR
jgi:hypothetical protein